MKGKEMSKMEEIERVRGIAEEDSYLGNLLKGFEDRFEKITLGDEYFNLESELEKRDKRIEELESKLERAEKEWVDASKDSTKYMNSWLEVLTKLEDKEKESETYRRKLLEIQNLLDCLVKTNMDELVVKLFTTALQLVIKG